MSDGAALHNDAPFLPRTASSLGFFLLAAMVGLSPLVFIPATTPWFHPATPQILMAKILFVRLLAGVGFVCGALCFMREGVRPWRERGLATLLLVGFGLAQVVSCLGSGETWFSWRQATLGEACLVMALLSPLFVNSPGRRRAILLVAIAAGLVVAVMAIAGLAGFAGFNKLIYGADPLELIRTGGQNLKGFQGGRRGATMATLGNPEYTGTYLAVVFLGLGCWLLDGFGGRWRDSLAAWWLGMGALAVVAAGMAATGTRASWIVVALGMLCRWLAASSCRGLQVGLAGMFTAAAICLLGARWGVLVGAAWVVATAASQWHRREAAVSWRSISGRNRVALLVAPVALGILLLAFSVPGPWNPRGLRMAQSFAGLTTTSDNSVRERFFFWMLAGDMLSRAPLLGAGPGMYGPGFHRAVGNLLASDDTGVIAITNRRLGRYIGEFTHSDHFQMLAETGVLGYGLFTGAMIALLATLRRHFRGAGDPVAGAVLVCLAGYLAMMLTSFPLHDPGRLPVFWGLAGLAFSFKEVR